MVTLKDSLFVRLAFRLTRFSLVSKHVTAAACEDDFQIFKVDRSKASSKVVLHRDRTTSKGSAIIIHLVLAS